jgi:hypothetical protein
VSADLPDFVTPVSLGAEPCEESDWRLADDVHRELVERLESFRRARAAALISARNYMVWR